MIFKKKWVISALNSEDINPISLYKTLHLKKKTAFKKLHQAIVNIANFRKNHRMFYQ